jgi:hypothetical protein
MASAFMWQLEEFPKLPENNGDLMVVLIFELTLNNPCSKWHCTFTDYKHLEEHMEELKLPCSHVNKFVDEGHVPFNSTDFMAFMLCVAKDCPNDHVTVFYWDLTTGNLIEYKFISYCAD